MSHQYTEIKKLAVRVRRELKNKHFNVADNIGLLNLADLCFFENKLKEITDFEKDKHIQILKECGYSDSDITICSNFYKYDDKFKSRILKNKLLTKKLIIYSSLKGEKFSPHFKNEVNFHAAEYAKDGVDIEKHKKHLDKRPKRYSFYKEAWVSKVLREKGFL